MTDTALSAEAWYHLFKMAESHRILPLVFDSAYSAFPYDEKELEPVKVWSKLSVSQQAIRTQRFLEVYRSLSAKGLEPVIIKGIVCRSLYPKPDLRASSDEDMLILPEETQTYTDTLATVGLKPVDPDDVSRYQTSFVSDEGLHIELHKSLFSTDSEYFAQWNSIFEEALGRAVYIEAQGARIKTLAPTDHLLYLILHAMKHFLSSGVGIRQVCDIVMYANFYGEELDWEYILRQCERVSAEKFAAAVFAIGRKYLNFDINKAKYPEKWQNISVDEAPLLEDVLSAGIYGGSDRARRHSGSITLNAAQGRKESLARRLFPSAKTLSSRYAYVKKYPMLLPVAWSHRLIMYGKETNRETGNTPLRSLQVGKERLELLRRYGLLPE